MKTKSKKSSVKSKKTSKKSETKTKTKKKNSQKLTPEELEKKKWKEFAADHKVTTPFFQLIGRPHVRRTSDGKTYNSPEEFVADGGAHDWSNVSVIVD